ncbi:MAG TPA: amidohydrolase family protein [Acidimicrobiia bacterium]|nr:amidohydrolase family protein [Acidimicrobiia bacterium]
MKKKRRQARNHPEMTPQELARCRPASEVDRLGLPIPTHLVSNEEYFPPFLQTAHQKQVEARVLDALESVPTRLNISRRRFLTTSAGLAASFVALNEVFRDYAFGESLFRVGKDGVFDHGAFLADGPPSDLFVFDDQCHLVRGAGPGHNIGVSVRAIAQGESARLPNSPFVSNPWNPHNHPDEHGEPWANWNPTLIGRSNWDGAEFWLPNFIKYYFFESQTSVALISNITMIGNVAGSAAGIKDIPATARNVYEARPQEVFVTAEQNFACREFINSMAGSTRALSHGLMYMGPGNLWYLQEQIDRFGVDSWKGYQVPNAKRDDSDAPFEHWTFDDEELAFPTFAFIQEAHRKYGSIKPGLNCICVHKGLGDSAVATDIPGAAAAFPGLNFVIYHSCIRPGFFDYEAWQDVKSGRLRDGVPDIKDTTEFAQLVAPYPNVYAELGTIFASSVVTFPTLCAHLMGILFKYLGADRIVWGTDSTFYGSPQWQIEAFWRLQIPEEFRKRYGYPEITPEMKRKVLGLNSARLYGMSPDVTSYTKVPADYHDRIVGDTELMRTMEYDDRLPNEAPMSPYGSASANRNDRFEKLRAGYREGAETRFGVPHSNRRDGWIRVR